MKIPQTLYCIAVILVLTSCTQLKKLTDRDNSTNKETSRTSKTRDVKFLDNISVTPGDAVTSNHSNAIGPAMPSVDVRIKEREMYNKQHGSLNARAGDIEKADWLQLKYAIVLDATVESLKNIDLLRIIDEWWGTGYCTGGSSKDCIDCSGFAKMVMQNVYNISLPRTAQDQFNSCKQIGMQDLNEGDLVFFHTGGRDISHVGVYLFNNKFVHAATSGGVMVSDLNDNYWRDRFKGAGRYLGVAQASLGEK